MISRKTLEAEARQVPQEGQFAYAVGRVLGTILETQDSILTRLTSIESLLFRLVTLQEKKDI